MDMDTGVRRGSGGLHISGPAHRDPVRFVLHPLDDGAELHAGLLQIVIHQHAVEELFVLGLHEPGRVLQLREVLLLQMETCPTRFILFRKWEQMHFTDCRGEGVLRRSQRQTVGL